METEAREVSAGPAATALDEAAAWDCLSSSTFGRLAVSVSDQPDIFPVNYAARRPAVWIRTAEGTKLLSAVVNARVALETDRVDEHGAISIVGYGTAVLLSTARDIDEAAALGLTPWVPTVKQRWLRIDLDRISGRRFVFGPEPEPDPTLEPPG